MERIVQQPSTASAQRHFSEVPSAEVERSTFDRSHGHKTTMDAGLLVPVLVDEVLPGDTFKCNATVFARLATPLKPLMHDMTLEMHYFFVPNRLVWDNWQKFMGERVNPDDDPNDYDIPKVNINLNEISGTLADYYGLPLTEAEITVQVNALPFRCYPLIFNEWFRDQNLMDSVEVPKGDEGAANWFLFRRAKRSDYFTRSLPFPQKGDPVFLPLGEFAPVVSTGDGAPEFNAGGVQGDIGMGSAADDTVYFGNSSHSGNVTLTWADTKLVTDLTLATAATINDIRTAFQVQRMLERDARGGTRYIELVLSHFGVRSDDARLQRPEILGLGSAPISINPVAATAPTEEAPQANLAAVGTGVLKAGFTHSFTEHGWVIGLLSTRSDLIYQDGIERMWSRTTRYDHYWPALSHLGEQAVLNKEIFVSGTDQDDETWGYQERYAEYRYKPGRVTGKFRSKDPESLDVWHLAQDFDSLPALSVEFIAELPPVDRVIAVPSEPHFLVDIWFDYKCTRPMPVYSVPGLVDHF